MSKPRNRLKLLSVGILIAALTVGGASSTAANAAGPEEGGQGRCTVPALAGDTTVDLSFGGSTYPVLVYVPKDVRGKRSIPLVLNLHPQQRQRCGPDEHQRPPPSR